MCCQDPDPAETKWYVWNSVSAMATLWMKFGKSIDLNSLFTKIGYSDRGETHLRLLATALDIYDKPTDQPAES
jgi:hypothetical protein